MSTSSSFPPLSALMTSAVLLTTLGCAQAVNAGLGLLGVERQHAEPTQRSTRPTSPKAPEVATSTYRHSPTLGLQDYTLGRPYHPSTTLLDHVSPGSCAIAPQGVSRVLPVAEGSPALPIETIGPLEVGIAGASAVEAETLFARGAEDLAWRMMERTSRLSTNQDGCGFRIFLYLGLAGTSATEPVLVSH